MPSVHERISQLEAALAAQETLRATLGDAIVDTTIAALRAQLEALRAQAPGTGPLAERLQSYIPRELADKMRATGRIEGERKQVTVMFSDISGFTALSARLDPEEVTTITNEALRELANAVYEYEGYIDKFMGDAIMAVFGAPVSHEDDPERALRAALAMDERMEAFNRRWAARLGQRLALHTGINTGTVIAGDVGSDLRLSYTVMGDTVNIAARLKDAAQPGQVLVSEDTYTLTREAFSFKPLDPVQVKGKAEPLTVFQLQRASLDPGKSRGLKGLAARLVGRERELAQLRDVQRRLAGGKGWVVALSGEAGLGKSRLLAEWQAELTGRAGAQTRVLAEQAAEGARQPVWLEGRAFAHTTAQAYGPFLYLFRRQVGIQSEDSETQARTRLEAAIARLFTRDPESRVLLANLLSIRLTGQEAAALAGISAEALRRKLFALVEELFARVARQQPAWFIIEDMHWADITSIELLEHLVPLTADVPLAIVAVFRRDTDDAPRRFLRAVQSTCPDRFTRIALTPLSEPSSLDMVRQLLSMDTLPDVLRELILDKAEGNPFFVEEVIRALIARGALVRGSDGISWQITPLIEGVTVPDTLQGMIMARLDRLPAETKWVAQQAAVIGRIFAYRVLRRIAEDMPGLDADLRHLEREELVRQRAHRAETEYIFKHALTQETAYQSLLAPRRKELHRKVGEAVEALFADRLTEFHSLLATHFLQGEEWDKAVDYLVKSGDDAARLYAYAEGHLQYTEVLKTLGRLPQTLATARIRVDTILKMAEVAFTLDDPALNLARLAEAEALSRILPGAGGQPPDNLSLARVHYQMGRAHLLRNEPREGIARFRNVLAVAHDLGDEELIAGPSGIIGQALVWQGRFGQAAPLLEHSIETVQRSGKWLEWIWTIGYLGATQAARGNCAGARRQSQLVLARATETNDLMALGAAHLVSCIIALMCGDSEEMIREANAVLTLAEQSGARVYVYQGYAFRAWAESRLGRHADAAVNHAKSKAVSESLGGRLILADWFAAADAEIALRAGRPLEAVALAEQAVLAGQAVDSLYSAGLAHRVWGQALAALDPARWDEAQTHLAASLQACRDGEAGLEAARTHQAWGELCRQFGEDANAQSHFLAAAREFESAGLDEELVTVKAHL